MKSLTIIANWKSNKTLSESQVFLREFSKNYQKSEEKEIIICPSNVYLQFFSDFIKQNNLDIKLGAQNVSQFEEGSFTGEVNARQLRDFASYCIVGHSERRQKFFEDSTVVEDKVEILKKEGIIPIVCMADLNDLKPNDFTGCIIAYEPPFDIGTGNPQDPSIVQDFGQKIKSTGALALYGASVSGDNVHSFTSLPSIDGVLVGTESLDPKSFLQIINNA